jgi:hypothetical protein
MQLTPEELERITGRTLAHYDQNAQAFWEAKRYKQRNPYQ